MVHDLKGESFLARVSKALGNKRILGYPEHLKPARKGEAVLGRLEPEMQALFLLVEDLKKENKALEEVCGHGEVPCTVCAHSDQFSVLNYLFFVTLREKYNICTQLGPGLKICADWSVVEDMDPREKSLFKSMLQAARSENTLH